MKTINLKKLGYIISVTGVALILIWIGVFKFTPTEAKAISPLIENSFLVSWMYKIGSLQLISNFIGTVEIISGLCLILHFFWKKAGIIGGILSCFTFMVTLSFLFSTPNIFKTVDGVLITDFFILKDMMALGISMLVLGNCLPNKTARA